HVRKKQLFSKWSFQMKCQTSPAKALKKSTLVFPNAESLLDRPYSIEKRLNRSNKTADAVLKPFIMINSSSPRPARTKSGSIAGQGSHYSSEISILFFNFGP